MLARKGISPKLVLRRQLRALEGVARRLAKPREGAARGYLFVVDVGDATVSQFLGNWKFWHAMATYEARYYPAMVRRRTYPRLRLPRARVRTHGASVRRGSSSPLRASRAACLLWQLGAVCVIRAPSFAGWALGLCKRGFLGSTVGEKITLDINADPLPVLRTLLPPELIAQMPDEYFAAGHGLGHPSRRP